MTFFSIFTFRRVCFLNLMMIFLVGQVEAQGEESRLIETPSEISLEKKTDTVEVETLLESSSEAKKKNSLSPLKTKSGNLLMLKKNKNRSMGEKEAAGTKALNRFKDSVPKSKYEYNGQTLEVDPD